MIDRYSRQEMADIWTLESKFNYYLQVELAVCDAYAQIGQISKQVAQEIRQKAKFNIERIDEIEREVKHDVIAFLTCVRGFGRFRQICTRRDDKFRCHRHGFCTSNTR